MPGRLRKHPGAYARPRQTPLRVEDEELTIPDGLTRCPACGELRGLGVFPDGEIVIRCVCDGPLCRYCRENRIHRPISNYYSEHDRKAIHVPYFGYLKPCQTCWERAEPTSKINGSMESRYVGGLDRQAGMFVRHG